jgi:hypothetical protein
MTFRVRLRISDLRARAYGHLLLIVVSSAAAVNVLMCAWWIRGHIALTQDALWNVPSAALIVQPSNIPFPEAWSVSIGDRVLPLVTGPYLGPEKSFVLAGFAALLPSWADASFCFAICAYVVVVALTKLAGDSTTFQRGGGVAAAIVLLLSGFTLTSAIDYGPYLLGTALLLFATMMAFRALSSASIGALVLSSCSLGFALGDKFTIGPVALPVIVVLACSLWRHRTWWGWRGPVVAVIGMSVPMMPNFYYLVFRGGIRELAHWTQSSGTENVHLWDRALSTYGDVVAYGIPASGSLIARMISTPTSGESGIVSFLLPPTYVGWAMASFSLFALFAALAVFFWISDTRSGRGQPVPLLFASVVFLAPMVSMQIGATRPWHLLPYLPFMAIAVSIVLQRGLQTMRFQSRRAAILYSAQFRFWSVLVIAFLSLVLTIEGLRTLDAMAKDHRKSYFHQIAAPGTSELVERIHFFPHQQMVTLGYSIGIPVVAYAPRDTPLRVHDLAWANASVVAIVSGLGLQCGDIVVGRVSHLGQEALETGYWRLVYGKTEEFTMAGGPAKFNLKMIMSQEETPSGLVAWIKTGSTCNGVG